MIEREHYFDWAATAPADTDIQKKALEISLEHWGNPSSIHEAGTDAKIILEAARKRCASALGVKNETIYFTSGGTEGDHIPLLSVLTKPQKGSILISSIEHPAMREMAKMIKNCGWEIITVNPDRNGIIHADDVIANLRNDTYFVSVMAVNNETGAIQNIYEISDALVKASEGKRKPFFHVDCVQAAGKIPLELSHRGIDSASLSAHKIGGPRGIGVLYLSKEIVSFLRGGGQERNIRSGTENLFGAVAMSLCLEKYCISQKNIFAAERFEAQKKLTNSFIEKLKSIPGCSIIPKCREDSSSGENYSPWVVQAAFPGIPGQVMERALSANGFYISTGSACSSGHHSRPVLDSMQVGAKEKESAVRFSFGFETSEKSMEELAAKVSEIALQLAH